jgi:hypothetical protein
MRNSEFGLCFYSALRIPHSAFQSGFRLGLAQTSHAITRLPLAALFEEFDALEALQDISFCAKTAGGA